MVRALHRKNLNMLRIIHRGLGTGLILRYNLGNGEKDMRFGAWNVGSLYRSGSSTTVVRQLVRYKLDSVGVQEVRWDNGDTSRVGGLYFSICEWE